jgi:hypothetical protein
MTFVSQVNTPCCMIKLAAVFPSDFRKLLYSTKDNGVAAFVIDAIVVVLNFIFLVQYLPTLTNQGAFTGKTIQSHCFVNRQLLQDYLLYLTC